MKKKVKEFNIVIVGTGGQGLITLLGILSEAACLEGYDLRTSELHGLAQRGGSVEVHITFGEKVFSPLVNQGEENLVIVLEAQEALKACCYACPIGSTEAPQTTFLINDFFIPIPGLKNKTLDEIKEGLKKFCQKTIVVPAAEICQKELGTNVLSGVYLLALASFQNLIPLDPKSVLKAIEAKIPEHFLELNKKAFALAKKHAKI